MQAIAITQVPDGQCPACGRSTDVDVHDRCHQLLAAAYDDQGAAA